MLLYPGTNTVVAHVFPAGVTNPTVEARDFNGIALPITDPVIGPNDRWSATLTVPQGAPLCTPDSGYYQLTWTEGSNKTVYQFQVVGYDEGQDQPPPAALGVLNNKLFDELLLPSNVDTVTVKLLDPISGNVLIEADSDDIVQVASLPGGKHYQVTIPLGNNSLPVGVSLGVGEYLLLWEFGAGSPTMQDYRQAFMVSPMLISLVANMRNVMREFEQWLPRFKMHDVELIDCLHRAADRINTSPPQRWNMTPDKLHKLVAYPLREATIYEVLSRLYLAEGMAAFDYQGGSISANVDRTPFIQSRMSEASSWLDANLKQHKFAAARASGKAPVGRLHITVSPTGHNNNYAYIRNGNPELFLLSRFVPFGL